MRTRIATLALLTSLCVAPVVAAQVTTQNRSVEASSYFLDPWFGEDPVFDSESHSTTQDGTFNSHADATAGGFGSAANSQSDQFGSIDAATGSFNVHGYAFAQLYVQGTANVASRSLATLDFTIVGAGDVSFSDGDLSTYDAFLGQQTHDRPGNATAEVRIETVPGGVVLYHRIVVMGQPGTSLQEDVVPLAAGNYRMVLQATADDATNGVEQVEGSVSAATFDIVGTISGLGDPDTTPPAAPAGLNAVAGNARVDLSWTANSEPDLADYRVKRANVSGGPYQSIGQPSAPAFADLTATNNTTWFYVVTAVDSSDNESAASAEVAATPQAPVATTLHVASITLSTVAAGGNKKNAVASVKVVNNLGVPVAGAVVSGTFTGRPAGTATATTNAAGIAILVKGPAKAPLAFTFCVTGITHSTLGYAPGDNVETCENW